MSEEKSDVPDIPEEVLNRKPTALTPFAAETINAKKYMDEGGRMIETVRVQKTSSDKARLAREAAEEFSGPNPLAGTTPEQVAAIKAKNYPDLPAMDVDIGDRSQSFVNALWSKYPKDAVIRYAYRNIWPTEWNHHAECIAVPIKNKGGRPRKNPVVVTT